MKKMGAKIVRSSLRLNKQYCLGLLTNRSPKKGAVSGKMVLVTAVYQMQSSRNILSQQMVQLSGGHLVDVGAFVL